MWKKANRLKSTTFLDSFNSACFYEIFFPKTTDFSFFTPKFRFPEKKHLDLFCGSIYLEKRQEKCVHI